MHYATQERTQPTSLKATYLPWVIWFLGAFFYFYECMIQVSPSVMVHDLMHDLSLDAGQLGILAGVYFYTYALIQIPAGVLTDNVNIRFLLVTAITFCILGCTLFATSNGMLQAALGRLLIGLGSGFAVICSLKLATLLFPARRFSFLVGLMVTLGMTGSIVGGGPLALVIDNLGWRDTLYTLALLGVVLASLVAWLVREPFIAKPKKSKTAESMPLLHGLKQVLVCKKSWAVAGYGGLMFAPTSIFGGLWGVPFIMEAYHLDKPEAASLVSLLFLGWVIGGPMTGIIAAYVDKKRPIMLCASVGAFSCISLILYCHMPLFVLSVIIFAFGLFSSCFLPAFSLMKEMHDDAHSGAALGLMNTANMTGGAIGLPLVGLVLNYLWDGTMLDGIKIYTASNYATGLSILPLMMLLSLGLLTFIKEHDPAHYAS